MAQSRLAGVLHHGVIRHIHALASEPRAKGTGLGVPKREPGSAGLSGSRAEEPLAVQEALDPLFGTVQVLLTRLVSAGRVSRAVHEWVKGQKGDQGRWLGTCWDSAC